MLKSCAILGVVLALTAAGGEPDGIAFFETKIRPLLVEHCYKCHSTVEKKTKGGLLTDSLAALLKGGESGPALIPGKPELSRMIEAVSYKNNDMAMPPKGKLSDAEIGALTNWVLMGAQWPKEQTAVATETKDGAAESEKKRRMAEHWAWKSPQAVVPPDVKDEAWVKSPVDRFVLAKLEAKNLKPAVAADKRTLIRRATFDLTGLPPTPEQIDAFLSDSSTGAFAKVVDRLLASPQYGERWGRHWLDIARYAESNGMDENLVYANAFRYRDYVVESLNQDKPYDQFLREQIAGDLMPVEGNLKETQARQIATGFIAIGPKLLAEPDAKKMEMDIIDEQLDTLGRSTMGLTLGCARCHDHKFDPLPTADYYSLAAMFKSTKVMENFKKVAKWYERPLDVKQEAAAKAHDKLVAEKRKVVEKEVSSANEVVLGELRRDLGKYLYATSPEHGGAKKAAEALKLNEQVVKNLSDYLERVEKPFSPIFSPWSEFRKIAPADFAVKSKELAERFAGEPTDKKRTLAAPVRALFGQGAPESMKELSARYGKIFSDVQSAFDEMKAKPDGAKATKLTDAGLESLRVVLHDSKSGPVTLPKDPVPLYSKEASEKIKVLKAEIATLENARPAVLEAMGATEGEIVQTLKIHIRGNPQTLGTDVPKRFPSVIAGENQKPLEGKVSGRLQLANWLTQPNHPLTTRVMVNRMWRWHFGSGIVSTTDNFGLLGEKPSHPELLDWLALQFIDKGWSMKSMHRMLMLSAVYQMGSEPNEAAELADPENRLRWRFSRQRLEAEAIRDAILLASGQLDLTQGGSLLNGKNRDYVSADKEKADRYDSNRRSIYLPVIRNAGYNVFQVFDFPDSGVSNGNRLTTTVAPQALFMLNGSVMISNAGKMAELLLKLPGDDEARIHAAYLRAVARPPGADEKARAIQFLAAYSNSLEKSAVKTDPKVGAWQAFCQALMASNEFVYLN